MLKRPKRKAYILIEVLVATSLFVMLLVAIFGIFWRTSKTNTALNKLRVANEHVLITQAKLQTAFSNALYAKSIRPYFYAEKDKNSGGSSLIFTINTKTEHSHEFSGTPLLKLYIEDDQLILATFPHFEMQPGIPKVMRKEALLSDATDLKIEFFLAPQSQQQDKVKKQNQDEEESTKKPPSGTWTDVWLKEYNRPPTLLKLHVTRSRSESCTLYFFMPYMIDPILYDRE